jgi:septum formation protein
MSSTTTDSSASQQQQKQKQQSDSTNPLVQYGLPSPVLLGSASFTRKLILKEMNVPFVKFVRPIDEKALGDRSSQPPEELVLQIAQAKMDELVAQLRSKNITDEEKEVINPDRYEYVVLTGDQVVTCDNRILEKPESIEEAIEFVSHYARHPPSTVGSCILYHHPSGLQVQGVDTATIYFNTETLQPTDLVRTLVDEGEPVLSCAGGLMIEHPLVQQSLNKIDGTQDSVMGLSKRLVLSLLEELSTKLKQQQEEEEETK